MNIPTISLKPTPLFTIGSVVISNSMMGAFLVSLILLLLAIHIKRNASIIPGRIQVILEMIVEFFSEQLEAATNSKKTTQILMPIIVTVFLFLILGNLLLLFPFVGDITLGDHKLFATPAAHYSLPIALTLMILLPANIVAFLSAPLKYTGNFVRLHALFKIRKLKEVPMALVDFFLGFMDIIGELAKFISTPTRLFGNMFAGGVVVAIISGLLFVTQFVAPIPFIILGILAAVVQAFVFTMLMLIFVSMSLNSVKEESNT